MVPEVKADLLVALLRSSTKKLLNWCTSPLERRLEASVAMLILIYFMDKIGGTEKGNLLGDRVYARVQGEGVRE